MTIKKITKSTLVSLIVGISCAAAADETPKSSNNYVSVRAGLVVPSTIQGNSDLQSVTPKITGTVGISIGRQLTERFGAELEYTYRGKTNIDSNVAANSTNSTTNTSNTWAVSANTFMVNATANLLEGQHMVMPYLKAGVGISMNKSYDYVFITGTENQTWKGKSKSNFAWKAAFGINISTSSMIDTNFEYAYVDRGNFKTNSVMTGSASNQPQTSYTNTAKTGNLREQVITLGFKVKF